MAASSFRPRSLAAIAMCIASLCSCGDAFQSGVVDGSSSNGEGGSGGNPSGTGGEGGAPSCNLSVDCPAPASSCRIAVCNDGKCGGVPVPVGFQPPQVTGDCKVLLPCDGSGQERTMPAPDDVIDDANECTIDACEDGATTHTANVGAACSDGQGHCNEQAHCVECTEASHCPGTECRLATCVDEQCGNENADQGEPCEAVKQCNGTGQCGSCVEASDCEASECEIASCNVATGQCTFVPELARVSCKNGAGLCDGQGECVACLVAEDCKAPSECTVAQCNAGGVCGAMARDAGTECQGGKCDGSGNCVACVDPAIDCPAPPICQYAYCNAGTCAVGNQPEGTFCSAGTTDEDQCDGSGACVDCTNNGGCGECCVCTNHACVPT